MNKRIQMILLMVLLLGLFAGFAGRQMPASLADGDYVLVSGTTAAGSIISGGPYTLRLAVGQTEAGLQDGGAYEIGGGFWGGGPVTKILPMIKSFLPLLLDSGN